MYSAIFNLQHVAWSLAQIRGGHVHKVSNCGVGQSLLIDLL